MRLLMLDLRLRLDVGASNGLRLRLELLGRLQFVMMMMMMVVRFHRDLEDEKKEDKEVDAEKSPRNLDPDRKVRGVFGRENPSWNSLDGRLRLDGG